MDENIRFGRVAGIPVGANWSLLVVFWLMASGLATARFPNDHPGYGDGAYWAAAVVTAMAFYVALLAHELGHALMARRQGIPVQSITLWLFGGVTRMNGESASPEAALRVAVIGPAVSLVGAGLFAVLALLLDSVGAPPLLGGVAGWLAGINLILAIFNLLPAAPLDGGRILQSVLWRRRGDRFSASVTAARAGRALGYFLVGLGVVGFSARSGIGPLWLVFLGVFLLMAARSEQAAAEARLHLEGVSVGSIMTPHPVIAPGWLTVDAFLEDYAPHHRFSSFPVQRFDGALAGLVTLHRLKAVQREEQASVRVLDVTCGMGEVPVTRSDALLLDLVGEMVGSPDGRALVIDDGQLVGIVSPTDVARALELAAVDAGRAGPAPGRRGSRRLSNRTTT